MGYSRRLRPPTSRTTAKLLYAVSLSGRESSDELVSLLETSGALPRRRFVLTFDDAFVGVLRYAAPLWRRTISRTEQPWACSVWTAT